MPPLLSEQAAFAKHLFTEGYPLWNPDPVLLPQNRQSAGLRIGDLGTIDERGRFEVFFNIFEPPPGGADTPPDFPSIEENSVRCTSDNILPRQVVSSPETHWEVEQLDLPRNPNITYRTTHYSATLSNDGAHIILPQGAELFDLSFRHRKLFEQYARENGTLWLERYKEELGWPRSDSLYLLTGFYKTCSWCIASFSMQRAANTNPEGVYCVAKEVEEQLIQEDSVWQPAGRFKSKIGPEPNRQGRNNQTVFIRAIVITPNVSEQGQNDQQQAGLLRMLSAPARYLGTMMRRSSKPADTEAPKSNVIIQHLPDLSQASHPSEIINRFLLAKEPSMKFAVTHDNQWITMLQRFKEGQLESWTLGALENHLETLVSEHSGYAIFTYKDCVYLQDDKHGSPTRLDIGGSSNVGDIPEQELLAPGSFADVRHIANPPALSEFASDGSPSHSTKLVPAIDAKHTLGNLTTYESNGDLAVKSADLNKAIVQYSTALSLNPSDPAGLLVKRSSVQGMLGSWEDALKDADAAIKANKLSPWGYERKHAALHALQRYDEAISAFSRMHSLVAESHDPAVRQLRNKYISPARSEKAIDDGILWMFRTCPFVLIDVKSGRLCDGPERTRIFKLELEFKQLRSSLTEELDEERIRRVIENYFQYVTLSHVWEGKEPLLQDVQTAGSVWALDSSPCHEKLRRFCEVVREEGYRWAWSDTCCIDKMTSTILNQSLIMMYQWYEASAATFIRLADVMSPSTLGQLTSSIWMTRAWTAQELLAARVIRFYTRDWKPYLHDMRSDHKKSPEIMQELASAIGIDRETLVSFDPDALSVREKLRLASTRNATVEEDVAYSLIGIFKSNIAPRYGEGKAALGHLLEEIVTRSGDVTVLAWSGVSSSYNSCLPASLAVYARPPGTSPIISDTDMDEHVAALRNSLSREHVMLVYDRITSLPPARFANRRLYLPCITFAVKKLSLKPSGSGSESCYRARVQGIGHVEFQTSDSLSLTELRRLVFVYPWIRDLYDPLDSFIWGNTKGDDAEDSDNSELETECSSVSSSPIEPATGMDDYTRALRLVVRLQHPFPALLLQLQFSGGFKRVAAEQDIIVPRIDRSIDLAKDIHAGFLEIL